MKKVLSVLLAGAMIMGMSVSAFADVTFGSKTDNTNDVDVAHLEFNQRMIVERDNSELHVDSVTNLVDETGEEFKGVEPGDILWFLIMDNKGTADVADDVAYKNSIDKDWSINIKGNSYVEDAEFEESDDDAKWIKVTVAEDLEDFDSEKVSFKLYIADHSNKHTSAKLSLKYAFGTSAEKDVDFDWSNDVEGVSRWTAEKKGTAVFDFEDNAYFTVNMIQDEEVLFNLSTAYDKAIDKAYNEYDADLEFLNFKGDEDEFAKKGELFIESSKDNKFIYEVVDGELVEVEAEYDESYKVGGVGTKKGYVIETNTLGYYVIADEELVVEEVEAPEEDVKTETSTPVVEDNKANPETGAADFVGAAVAMAVVSVAAAGALAMKK